MPIAVFSKCRPTLGQIAFNTGINLLIKNSGMDWTLSNSFAEEADS